jgi:Outer membrane protein beta-barrel domain
MEVAFVALPNSSVGNVVFPRAERKWLRTALIFASLLSGALPALAQQRFEIQPFVGYKFGGGADVAENIYRINRINIDSSLAYGATLTYNLSENFGVEFLWNRQQTHASGALNGGGTYPQKIGVTLDQFHGDFLLSLTGHGSKLEPFILVGLGATDMHGAGSSTAKFSFGVGGGVKYFVSRHLGFRIQARYAPTYLYSTSGGIWCNWWGVCWVVPNDHFLQQGDVTGGIILRF